MYFILTRSLSAIAHWMATFGDYCFAKMTFALNETSLLSADNRKNLFECNSLTKTPHMLPSVPIILFPECCSIHFNQSCGGPVLIGDGDAGIMCWGYSLSLPLFFSLSPSRCLAHSRRDDLVCVTVQLALGLEQSNTHSIKAVTLAVSGRLSQAVCYNLNLYLVSQRDDLTEKNKRICLDLRSPLEEVCPHLEV